MKRYHGDINITRRNFLKTAGISIASTLISSSIVGAKEAIDLISPNSTSNTKPNDSISYAVIGLGTMGTRHVEILKSLEESHNIKLTAASDVYTKRLQAIGVTAGLSEKSLYVDYRYLLDRSDIDVVVIATPEHLHAKMAIDAMESCKHVYCEKPMTRKIKEAFAMFDTAKRLNRLVQVGTQACTHKRWHIAKKIVDTGKLGKIIYAQTSFCKNVPTGEYNYTIDSEANERNVDWHMWLGDAPKRPWDPERYFRWRKYWDYSAGMVSDYLPHQLNPLLLALSINEFPDKVSCIGGNLCNTDKGYAERREIADSSIITVQFPSGSMISMLAMSTNEHGSEDVIRGQKANLYVGSNNLQLQPERPFIDEIDTYEETVDEITEEHKDHHKNFIQCLRTNSAPNCNIDLATISQVIISMAETSYREERMTRFDPSSRSII